MTPPPFQPQNSSAGRPWRSNLLLGWNVDPDTQMAGSLQPTAAIIYLAKIMVPDAITVGNILLNIAQAGTNYTNTQVGLYASDGTFLGASAVLASGGTNTFGTTGNKTIPLTAPVAVAGSDTAYVWVGLHMGTNGATVVLLPQVLTTVVNIGTALATSRFATANGSAVNPLATIGNLTLGGLSQLANPTFLGVAA